MIKKILPIFSILIIIFILHLSSIYFKLYSQGIPTDFLQHILAGTAFGYLWIIFLKKENLTKWIFLISTFSFAIFISFFWEIFEHLLSIFAPEFSQNYKLYSPNVGEALKDIFAGFLGGVISGFYFWKNKLTEY